MSRIGLTSLWTGSSAAANQCGSGCAPAGVAATGMVSPTGTARVALFVKLLADTRRISQRFQTHSNKIRPADRAWLALFLGVAVYEVSAREGELMSHSYDRWLINHPVFTWAATLITAAHLLNTLPPMVDPYNLAFVAWRHK